MRALSRSLLVGVVGLGLAGSSGPEAESAGPTTHQETVRFETVDRVTLHGTFYPSARGKKAPCALLLHDLGEHRRLPGWVRLAEDLQKAGLAVLSFDFRGHGDSTAVGPEFWSVRYNQALRGFRMGRHDDTIAARDFTTLFSQLMLVNDIAAAKHFLDQKNDAGECNAADVIVIGAETGAALGALWVAVEWQRRPLRAVGLAPLGQAEGENITAAVWVSPSQHVAGWRVPVANWLRSPVREQVPMYLVYGEDDARSARLTRYLCDRVLRADQLSLTGRRGLADTAQAGQALLADPAARGLVLQYVDRVLQTRSTRVWSRQEPEDVVPALVPFESFLR